MPCFPVHICQHSDPVQKMSRKCLSWWYFCKCANHLFITNCRRHFAFIRQGSCRCKKIQFSPTQIYFRQSFKLLILQFLRILNSIIHRFIYHNLTCAFWANITSSISLHLYQIIFYLLVFMILSWINIYDESVLSAL